MGGAETGVLLVFVMSTNMIAGALILPAFIAWQCPKVTACFEKAGAGRRMAAGD
jgi:hypothetical protein